MMLGFILLWLGVLCVVIGMSTIIWGTIEGWMKSRKVE